MQFREPLLEELINVFTRIPQKAAPVLGPNCKIKIGFTLVDHLMDQPLKLQNANIKQARRLFVRQGRAAFEVQYEGLNLVAYHGFNIESNRFQFSYFRGYHGAEILTREMFLKHIEREIRQRTPIRCGSIVFPEMIV